MHEVIDRMIDGWFIAFNNFKQQYQEEMSQKFQNSHEESIVQTEPNLSELKKEVEITPSTLKEITNKEAFLQRVIELNKNARESINIQRSKQAMIYLNEAQKILEYAASCGKTIDKYIIISVLHNIACCYQKLWQLDKCSQYLQALIFNFNSFMKVADYNNPLDNSTLKQQDKLNKSTQQQVFESIDRRTFLAKYYLQFCAVNSQTDNHSGALVAARKSIEITKSVFKELSDTLPSLKKMTYQKKNQFQYKVKLIQLGSRINDAVNINNYDIIYQAAKYYLRQWKNIKDSKDKIDRNYVLQEQFKNYSIGNAMQINPMVYKDFQERQTKNYTSKMVLEKILLMALGYFTISTELRLIAGKKNSKKDDEKTKNAELKQSQIYHLMSIIVAASCIPFQILYIKHVLSSYSNHYGGDLLAEDSQNQSSINSNLYETIIFPVKQQISIRKNTVSNSFTASYVGDQNNSKYQKQGEIASQQMMILDYKKSQSGKQQESSKNEITKKAKANQQKNKSKSKSKNLKSMTIIGGPERSDKASPMPKSPNAHLRSPVQKNNLIKVKTSYKLKVSTQKIVTTTNNPMNKQQKSRKKREVRAQNIQFDYFMGRSKDLKKLKKNIESGLNLASPRANNSRNSSKRDSPSMKYFEQMKPQSPTMFKNIKSPRKTTEKGVKGSIHQYYL